MPPLVNRAGWYRTRRGLKVWVRPNTTGWFDGLPYAVSREQGGTFQWTVDHNGHAYPSNHKIHQDSQGYWQTDLFTNHPSPCTYDLVEQLSEGGNDGHS